MNNLSADDVENNYKLHHCDGCRKQLTVGDFFFHIEVGAVDSQFDCEKRLSGLVCGEVACLYLSIIGER